MYLRDPCGLKRKGNNMKRNQSIKIIVGNGIFAAITAVLTFIPIPIGNVNINLGLIPIVLASIIFGVKSGLFVGLVNGICVLVSPATIQFFFSISPIGTILVCLLKTGLAGLFAGLIYKALMSKKQYLGVVLSSVIVPIANTSIFIIGSLIFFDGVFGELITLFIAANFIIEFVINLLLIPTIHYIVNIYKKKNVI